MNIPLAKNYFDGKISAGFVSLYASKSIIRIAGSLFGIFLPVFLYELFNENLKLVVLYFIAGSIAYILFVAIGAGFMNSFGFKRGLQAGSILGALYFIPLFFAEEFSIVWFFVISLTLLTFHRIFHWIPYHVDFAKFTDSKNRGREVGLLEATTNVIGVIAPFVAGVILIKFGFGVLFLIAMIIYVISIIPLIAIKRTHEKFSWSYKDTWQQLFSKKRRSTVLAYAADGAEGVIGAVIWPIFIFELLNGDYMQVGFIAALITGSTIILQLLVGKYADKKFLKGTFIKFGSVLYSLGWILKVFIATAFHIFIVDAYHKLMKIFLRIPFDALTYELAADEGHFVDEFTVLHEMSVHIGRVIMLVLVIILSLYFNIAWSFALAAIAAILLNFIRAKKVLATAR